MKKIDLVFMPEFFDRYINLVGGDKDLPELLEESIDVFDGYREQLIEFQNYQYEPEKWTPKELLQHAGIH